MFNKKVPDQNYQKRVVELEDILDSITDGFFSLNNDWEFSGMNSAFETLSGHAKDELIGKNYWEHFPKAKEQKFYSEYHAANEQKEVRHFEEFSTSLKKWVSVNVYPTSTGLNIFFTDVTEQHNMREALADSEHKISALINSTHDLIWSVDREIKLIYANHTFQEVITQQIGRAIAPGSNVLLAEFGEDAQELWKSYYDRALAGETFSILQETEDVIAASETTFNPIYNSKKEIIGVSCFLRNVGERLQHVRQIEQHNKNLEEIAWLYSHRVRKHVATILGLADVIDVADFSNPTNKEVLEGIASSAKELDEVIKSIAKKSTEKNSD